MAPAPFSVEDARSSILEDGFYHLVDPERPERNIEMEPEDFALASEYGLEFCKLNVLEDMRVRSILQSFFDWSGLGLYLRYRRDPGHIFSFRRGGAKAGLRVMIVHIWSKGSRATYYRGSHLHSLPTVKAANGLFEIPSAGLRNATCRGKEVEFANGGLVILDARLAFEIKQGSATTFAFTTKNELATWAKMILPNSPGLARKVAEMESTGIGVNFAFEE
ncbi:hypothetical protein CBS147333_9932 [Penicillium roqueforti]|nr:hypothetical protein CBS147333_9932 [Penicillium roqueforti]KAI3260859.1 hypothetical protein CBS147308_10119 [Penicillium roqueforti]KAI3277968.1 hypothetical protein DTO003C3_9928 [Penicillium roqueforti]